MDFAGITHILKCGSKDKPVWIAVGHVPVTMMTGSKPTTNDIMAGRVMADGLAYKQIAFASPKAWHDHAVENRVNICALAGCCCRTELKNVEGAL